MMKTNYSVQLGEAERAALTRIAEAWQVKRSDVVRIAIRALDEEVVKRPAAPTPSPDGTAVQTGQGVGDAGN